MNSRNLSRLSRRDFIRSSAASVAGLAVLPAAGSLAAEVLGSARPAAAAAGTTTVAVIKTPDRTHGVEAAMKLLDLPGWKGKRVLIKPNFNTSDPTPGSTHNDTLAAIIRGLQACGAAAVTVGESSGPPATKKVMEDKGIFEMAKAMGFGIINFEELAEADWVAFNPPGNHWEGGFAVPKPVVEAEALVSTCCLKTHAYGGVFTMSLKLAVGLTPKKIRRGLHRSSSQRLMIAELNQAYKPALIVLDGVEAFVDGGPSQGKKVTGNVFIAGTDRVAVDAVGVAVLKDLGSNEAIMGTKIFAQEQIARAVELGLGVSGPQMIRFAAPDKASLEYADRLKGILVQG